ncbi:hypothetical protein TWF718_010544 [Orbilia javanica]|uniref:Uncharacterized protein n=1 Tax=Orbilia javanica TaxID=47235 RepID=A0AAN8MYI4_9PEZI
MATAGPSRVAYARVRFPAPVITPTPTTTHDEDLLVALALQLEELDIESQNRKGKERAGKLADRHVALQEYRDILLSMSQVHADHRMAQSISEATTRDAAVLDEFVAAEATAVSDRQQALRLSVALNSAAAAEPATQRTIPQSSQQLVRTGYYSRPTVSLPATTTRPYQGLSVRGGTDYSDVESVAGSTEYDYQSTYSGYNRYDDDLASNNDRAKEWMSSYDPNSATYVASSGKNVNAQLSKNKDYTTTQQLA